MGLVGSEMCIRDRTKESKAIRDAVEEALNNGFTTEDIKGGKYSTTEVGDKVAELIKAKVGAEA